MPHLRRISAIKLPDERCSVGGDHRQEPWMTPLSHLVFGAAIAVLIAVDLVLLFPGSKESSRPQQAHVTSTPLAMQ
jgi:hypothetical protein